MHIFENGAVIIEDFNNKKMFNISPDFPVNFFRVNVTNSEKNNFNITEYLVLQGDFDIGTKNDSFIRNSFWSDPKINNVNFFNCKKKYRTMFDQIKFIFEYNSEKRTVRFNFFNKNDVLLEAIYCEI